MKMLLIRDYFSLDNTLNKNSEKGIKIWRLQFSNFFEINLNKISKYDQNIS